MTESDDTVFDEIRAEVEGPHPPVLRPQLLARAILRLEERVFELEGDYDVYRDVVETLKRLNGGLPEDLDRHETEH